MLFQTLLPRAEAKGLGESLFDEWGAPVCNSSHSRYTNIKAGCRAKHSHNNVQRQISRVGGWALIIHVVNHLTCPPSHPMSQQGHSHVIHVHSTLTFETKSYDTRVKAFLFQTLLPRAEAKGLEESLFDEWGAPACNSSHSRYINIKAKRLPCKTFT